MMRGGKKLCLVYYTSQMEKEKEKGRDFYEHSTLNPELQTPSRGNFFLTIYGNDMAKC